MKFANLGFKTKEGLSLAHYSDGWSMEYGEGGSYTVDVLLNGKIMARAFEEGNGGPWSRPGWREGNNNPT